MNIYDKEILELKKQILIETSNELKNIINFKIKKNTKAYRESLLTYLEPQNKKVLVAGGIMGEKELEARVEIELEKYMKKIQIDSLQV